MTAPGHERATLSWWGRRLFQGRQLSSWERDTGTLPRPLRLARRQYRDFAQTVIAPRALAADEAPAAADVRELFRLAAGQGFQTELLPWPWGTMRWTAPSAPWWSLVLKGEEFAAACGGLGGALLAHDVGTLSLLVAGSHSAFQGLRTIYREIKNGEPAMTALAVSEPRAGSDLLRAAGGGHVRLSCRYRRVWGGFRLWGRKCFVANGPVAHWLTLFAAETGRGLESWTCFLLDRSMAGLSVGRREHKLGQRAADVAEVVLEDVFVPERRVIGGAGRGWAIHQAVTNVARPVTAALALGIARGALEQAHHFCQSTSLNGRPLVSYQDVQLALADMLIKVEAMRATLWQTSRQALPLAGAGAGAKVFCSEASWQVCRGAMELLGDHGYLHSQGAEKAARDARLTLIAAGTNEINRLALFEAQLAADEALTEGRAN